MDGYITVSAKTLDDAITEALIQLGVTSDHLDYEVIEKGSAGFLGIGMKQAVIKARRKQEEPVEEPVVEEVEEKPVKKEVKEFKEEKKDFHKKEFHKKEHVKKDNFKKEAPKKEFVKKEVPKREVELAPVEDATKEACVKFVKDVLAAMDMNDVEVKAEIDEEGALSITMDGKNMGILIGKRGQTLDSLQYLTNRVANKMQDGYVRVKLDTEDYRRRRKQTLENLAKNIASKVKRTRRSVSLEPMNPYERRIIHSALQSDSAVSTHSEGEEPHRKVVITLNREFASELPRRNNYRRRNNNYSRDRKRPYQEKKD